MKKKIILGLFFIVIGYILGEILFENQKELLKINKLKNSYYFLQEGVYSDKNNLQNNLNKLEHKLIDYQKDKYYVYVGITKDKAIATKLKEIYEQKGIRIYQKEKQIDSEEFSTNVEQFDLLIKETKEEEQILTIEEVVLANYEEIIKKQ